jgi:N-acetylglucosaminyl-diphospho-decaprenol L-rhamnosyltransferase
LSATGSSPQQEPRLSVVIVTFNSKDAVGRNLPVLLGQLRPDDELVVVDNASTDGTADVVTQVAPNATVLRNETNEGFASACNRGAERAGGELLLFLNPDAAPASGFVDAIRRPALDGGHGWAAWMGLVTDGGSINTSGGVIHFTGIAWAGNAGHPLSEAPRLPREVPFVSGACFAVRSDDWRRHRGFPAEFFMYCEDVDLSLRLRLAGGRLGIEPDARVDHDYDFAKGQFKWRMLERNRWAMVIRTYPGPLLLLLGPGLLATELALVFVSLSGGWGGQKALATIDTLRSLPRLLRERRTIQAGRRISAGEFAVQLSPDLSSHYLGRASVLAALSWPLRAYWWLVRALLRFPRT